ncbi:mitogen-activated protein kinase kinase kinase 5-like isoform X1 [Musa acuminata AAA Group]|uniref:mitogen-activated protein kinase kinase kinase 5-like isoform X1 n=1 Tax=Musa acuminata AAA Group TaxID=214697 RepID=UPI0031D603A3
MAWWNRKNAVSPSSSSPSSSSSPASIASSPVGRSWSRDLHLPWSSRRVARQHERPKLSDIKVGGLSFDTGATAGPCFVSSTPVSPRSSNLNCNPGRISSSLILLPRPLPLPEFVATAPASPHRECTPALGLGFSSPKLAGCPLPSPKGASSRSEGNETTHAPAECSSMVDPINEKAFLGGAVGSGFPHQSLRRSSERSGISLNGFTFRRHRKRFQDPNSAGYVNFMLNIPAKSAPASGFSSPVWSPISSPRRSNNVDFSTIATRGLQVRSATEMSSTDRESVFPLQTSSEEFIGGPDQTAKSLVLRTRNPTTPSSPLHRKMLDNSASCQENGGNISVHPLPLPPVAAPPSQSGFSHNYGTNSELLSMRSQWKKGNLIGSGTFGNVYEATNIHTGALCAMKEVNIIPDDAKSAECIKQLEQEIKFLSEFRHPNVVQYYGSETIDDQFYIYLEYVHPGSINKYVHQHCGAMTESVVRNFTHHILKGLAYLHGKDIMHRDIKGANLLVDARGVVKLADFGMAKHLSGVAGTRSLKGSPYWMAPEVMEATMNKDIGYDLAVDIWSLGCTIIEMFTGKQPWSGLEGAAAMFKVLHKNPTIPESLSNDAKDFLQCCFRRNPAERPTANMLLEHPFIQLSDHYNGHGSLQAFAGIKIIDNTISTREKNKSRSESCVRGRHSINGESRQSHPGTSETDVSRVSPRSAPEIVLSPSQPQPNHIMSSSSSTSANILNSVRLTAANVQPCVLPMPYKKAIVNLS